MEAICRWDDWKSPVFPTNIESDRPFLQVLIAANGCLISAKPELDIGAFVKALCDLLKFGVFIFNGLFALFALFAGFLWMAADIGGNEALDGLAWMASLSIASVAVILALIVPESRHSFVWAGYGGVTYHVIAAIWTWITHFNLFSQFSPPMITGILGGLALLNAVSLALNRPPQIDPFWTHRNTRHFVLGSGLVIAIAIGVLATPIIRRICAQYPYAKQFLRLGGSVRWESGWVVGVYLKGTKTADDDLVVISHFPKLLSLYLSNTSITDAGLDHLSNMHSLEHLYLDNTAITDRGVEKISNLVKLQNLWLHGTKVSDLGLKSFKGMTEMGYLDLGNTQVTDSGLPLLYGMTKLYYLHLPGTGVTDEGLESIVKAIPHLSTYNGRTHFSNGRRIVDGPSK